MCCTQSRICSCRRVYAVYFDLIWRVPVKKTSWFLRVPEKSKSSLNQQRKKNKLGPKWVAYIRIYAVAGHLGGPPHIYYLLVYVLLYTCLFYSFCFFFLRNGGGAAAPNPTRKLEACCFVACCFWGEWLRLHTPSSQTFAFFFRCFCRGSGGGLRPKPRAEAPCPPTLGDTKGARRGTRDKGGGAAAPNP